MAVYRPKYGDPQNPARRVAVKFGRVRRHPETTIFYDPETGWYGFSTRFPGQPPHHTIATFDTVDQALAWCDPRRERIWEEASDPDETKLLISRDYRGGTVGWRMAHLTLAELSSFSESSRRGR